MERRTYKKDFENLKRKLRSLEKSSIKKKELSDAISSVLDVVSKQLAKMDEKIDQGLLKLGADSKDNVASPYSYTDLSEDSGDISMSSDDTVVLEKSRGQQQKKKTEPTDVKRSEGSGQQDDVCNGHASKRCKR